MSIKSLLPSFMFICTILVAGAASGEPPAAQRVADPVPAEQGERGNATAPPKVPTWKEVEQRLDALRKARSTSVRGWAELESFYDQLSRPAFTQSKDHIEHLKKLEAYRAEFPDSPTPLVVLGRTYIQFAWDARGGGFAFTVSEAGHELFAQRSLEAQRLLEESLKLGVKDGEVFARLVDVAKALGTPKDEVLELVEKGRKADPTYFHLYMATAEYLLPRWHGEPGDVERFANELTKKISGDDGLAAMGLVADRVHYYDRETLVRGQYDRTLLGKAGALLATRFNGTSRLVQFGAACTKVAGDHASAQRVRPLLGPFRMEDRVWYTEFHYEAFTKWAESPTIPGGEEVAIPASERLCSAIAFAPNERYLWVAERLPSRLTLLDLKSGGVRAAFPLGVRDVVFVAFDGEQKLAVASIPKQQVADAFQGLVVLDLESGEVVTEHPLEVQCYGVALNPKTRQIAWSERDAVRLLDLEPDAKVRSISFKAPSNDIAFSPDGKLLSAGRNSDALVYDVGADKVLHRLERGSDQHFLSAVLAVDGQGRAYVAGMDHRQSPPRQCLLRFAPDGREYEMVCFDSTRGKVFLSADCRLAAVTNSDLSKWKPSTIDIWDLATGKKAKQLPGHWSSIDKICFSSDNRRLASVTPIPDVIKIWSLADLELAKPADAPTLERFAVKPSLAMAERSAPQPSVVKPHEAGPAKTELWKAIEERLAELRKKRASSITAALELDAYYGELCEPASTQSRDRDVHLARLAEYRAAYPDSPTPLVVMARAHLNLGWGAKGNGPQSPLAKDSRGPLDQRAEEARRLLEQSLKMGVKDGEAFARLVYVAKALGTPKSDLLKLVEQGSQADSTYLPLYTAAAEYLLPSWHGEAGDAERFANELPKKIPGNEGLLAMGLVAERIHQLDATRLYRGAYDSTLLGKAGAALAKAMPESSRMVHFGAACTWIAQDHAAAQEVRPLIGEYSAADNVWSPNSHLIFTKWVEASMIPAGEETAIWSSPACLGIAFAPNPRFLWMAAQGGESAVSLFDLNSRAVRSVTPSAPGSMMNFAASAKQKLVAAAYRGSGGDSFQGIVVWDATTSKIVAQHPTTENCLSVALNPTARQVAWGEKDAFHLLDLDPGTQVRTIPVDGYVHAVSYSPDGKRVGVFPGGGLVADAASGEIIHKNRFANTESFAMFGLVGLDGEGRAIVFAGRFAQPPANACILRFSPDGSQHEVLVADLDQRAIVFLSPDCRLAAIGIPDADQWKPCGIDIWDLATGKKVKQLPGHWSRIGRMCFSSDNCRLASVGIMEDVIKIWSLDDLDLSKPSP